MNWYLTFEEATIALLEQIKRGLIDGDRRMVVVQEWKGEEDGRVDVLYK